jgi:4-hydroxybenzoate polyprenyltransferase
MELQTTVAPFCIKTNTVCMLKNYFSLVKFSHTIFAMPFAIVGFFLASVYHGYGLHWTMFLAVILCMVFARNAAMAFNRYLDRDIDALNDRTARREVPAGIISPKNALYFVIANCLLFCATTALMNNLVLLLSPVALFVILFYSYTKRFTAWCHVVLGIGLSLAPIGAYLAISGHFHWLPILFSFIVLSWTAGFDIIYSLQDEEFDRKHRLNSIPAFWGRKKSLIISAIIHTITAILVVSTGIAAGFSIIFWIGAAVFIALLIRQHAIVKPTNISKVNIAFMTMNGLASVLFALFCLAEIWLG